MDHRKISYGRGTYESENVRSPFQVIFHKSTESSTHRSQRNMLNTLADKLIMMEIHVLAYDVCNRVIFIALKNQHCMVEVKYLLQLFHKKHIFSCSSKLLRIYECNFILLVNSEVNGEINSIKCLTNIYSPDKIHNNISSMLIKCIFQYLLTKL